ncbi:hypothetical protein RI844_14145 [Thalassotalea fonticola]|uniref:Uncharacterized protein n=1 Tax=Thalassotalea fonticola TaxID=3065649 RepID=A0ABZ0GLW0_9GAMM|nr:hypothetical protein RI844_14145 [Colwelliaceae bacterium S1-1]
MYSRQPESKVTLFNDFSLSIYQGESYAITGVLLAINSGEVTEVYTANIGVATFFFMVGIVLHVISATDCSDLKIKQYE